MRARSLLLAVLLVCVAALIACGGGSKKAPFSTQLPATTPTMLSVQISPASLTMTVGATQQFAATGTYSDGTAKDMTASATWVSSNPGVVGVTSAGLATATSPGQATLSATVGGMQASVNVTVNPPPVASLESLQISPASPTMQVGAKQQLTATGTYSDGTTKDLTTSATWVSSNPGVVGVTSAGLATATSPGQATLSATVGAAQASANVTVTPASLVSLQVSPASPTMQVGAKQQLTATGTYSDGTTKDLTTSATWASSNPAVVGVTGAGLATAASPGQTTLSATVGALQASANVTVNPASLVSLQVSPASPIMPVGTRLQFTATGTYTDGTTNDLTASATWASSNTGFVSVTSAGLATAASPGQATLSATVGALQASTNVTVNPASLVSLQVSPASPTMPLGGTQQFTATGTYTDGTTLDLTTSATWASSNTGVVSVTSAGLATATSLGQTTLSATMGAVQASTNVTVGPPVVASISVVPAAASVPIGATQQFSANGLYTDGSVRDVTSLATWSSSPEASVNNSGLAIGVSSGAAQITAAIGQVSGSATLTVTSATLQSISINPDMPSIPIGGNVQFTVTGIWTDGFTQDLQPGVASWSSSLPGVATIDAVSGLAIGVGSGVSTITASVGNLSDTTTILVSTATLASISVTPNNPTISTTTRQQFSATGTFTDGSTMDISASVDWKSSSTGVATIDQTGLATPVAAGTTTITASFGAISGSTTLTVTGAKLLSIVVTPAMPSVPIGASQQFTATGTFDDGSNQDISTAVIWTSSSASVATISAAGLVTTTGMGSATITASFGAVSGSTTLTVTAVELQYISVLPNNPALGFRMKMQFTAYANYNDGSSRVLTGVVWSSSKPQIASISSSGLARSKHKSGPATITAHWNGLSGSTILTVSNATVVSITIAPATAQIPNHTTQQYTATAQMSDGSSLDVTRSVHWGTSNYLVATINVAGLASGLAPGTVTINCAYSNVSGSATLTVTNATISSLVLSPQDASVPLGASQQFTATGNFSDGSSMDISSLVLWTSSNIAVADFSSTTPGLALSSGKGTTTIGATFQGATTSTSLTVF